MYIYSYRDVCVCGHVNECSFIYSPTCTHLHIHVRKEIDGTWDEYAISPYTQHSTFQVGKMRQPGFWGTLDETQKRHPLRTIAEDWQRHLSKTVFKHATLEIRSFGC